MRREGDGRGPGRCPVARFRTLDPAMRESPQLDELPLLALVALDRLIQESDDDGRFLADPRSLMRAVFPRDNAEPGIDRNAVAAAVDRLAERGVVVLYEVAGQRYGCFPGWRNGATWQYQRLDARKYLPSRFPAPADGVCVVDPRGRGAPPTTRSVGSTVLVDNHNATESVQDEREWTGREGTGLDPKGQDRTRLEGKDRVGSASAGGAPASPPLPTGSELLEELRRIENDLPQGRNAFQTAREGALRLLTNSRSPEVIAQAQATLAALRTEAKARAAKGKNGVAVALASITAPKGNDVGREST